jgi:ClpP class serine protease
MRPIYIVPFILIVLNLCFAFGEKNDGVQVSGIEENPNYEPLSSNALGDNESPSDDDSSTDEYDEYDEEDEEEDEKSVLNMALAQTNKGTKKTIAFVRKYRAELTVACALFAFRREIYRFVLASTTVVIDGKRYVRFQASPTSILKIILFVDFMRKMQNVRNPSSLGPIPGPMGVILSELLKSHNNAFIPPVEQHYTFERLHDRYTKDHNAFKKAVEEPLTSRTALIRRAPASSLGAAPTSIDDGILHNKTTVVLDMKIDPGVSSMETIRDQVSFLLYQHRLNQKDVIHSSNETLATSKFENRTKHEMEVVILLESPGGSASDYGLASQHLARLRNEPGVTLTIVVDKVAASGGYMMACMSSPGQLYAAPFAVVGSIGVIGQTINIHKSLLNFGVQPLVFRGGKDKAPVGLVGEVTKEGLAKVQSMVDTTHKAFKSHVLNARPQLMEKIDFIATGDIWLGTDALNVGLIDKILTSDEYIGDKIQNGEKVLKLIRYQRPRFAFGHPHYGSGFVHSSIKSVSDAFLQFKSVLDKVSQILEDAPTSSSTDISGVCAARAFGVTHIHASTK